MCILGMLTPTNGMAFTHRGLRFGYFSQHHVDQLEMNCSSVELLQKSFPGKTAEEYRRQLGSFGVSGDLALQIVASLSGGQKSRVAFAKMCMGKCDKICIILIFAKELNIQLLANPNFLVLDEPTNHLDIETIEALGKAINKFNVSMVD
jgi:ATP-binding cassette, subfamily F, member 3